MGAFLLGKMGLLGEVLLIQTADFFGNGQESIDTAADGNDPDCTIDKTAPVDKTVIGGADTDGCHQHKKSIPCLDCGIGLIAEPIVYK